MIILSAATYIRLSLKNAKKHAVLHYIEKNRQAFMEKLPSEEIIEASINEFKSSRKGLPAHREVPASTQVIQFECNRQNQFYLILLSEGAIKSTKQLIKGQSSVYFTGTSADSRKTSPADRLLYHSRHAQELDEQFSAAYQHMRGVAQPYLFRYALWHCLRAQLIRLNPKERLHSLLLLCI